VLDNFEQVVEAGPLVSELLRGAAGLKVVVTSREALRISGEKVLAVPPLGLPSMHPVPPPGQLVQYEAVRLFIDRAVSVKSDFEVTNENAPAVAEICHRLDGLPLAIELAASRIRLFEPEMLLLRLDRGLGTTLTGGARELSGRQQTLTGAIAWSVELLTPDERMLFTRLSAFMGGFTMEAAEAVASDPGEPGMAGDLDVLDGIESLADKSLVRRDGGVATQPRFRMLETIRDHASGMAREAGIQGVMRDRHLAWITDLFTGTEEASRRAGGSEILDRLHAELGNLRQALGWASELPVDGTRVTQGLRTCVASSSFRHLRHDSAEGIVVLDRLLALVDPLLGGAGTQETLEMIPGDVLAYARTDAMRLRAHAVTGVPNWIRPVLDEAVTHFRNVGNRRGEGRALHALSDFLAYFDADGTEALATSLAAIDSASHAADAPTIAFTHHRVAIIDLRAGRDDEAGARFATALRLAESSGDTWAVAGSHVMLGSFLFSLRQWTDAEQHFAAIEATGGTFTAIARSLRADIAMHTGYLPLAHAHLARLEDGIAAGHLPGRLAASLELGKGNLARLEGRMEDAYACFRDVLASNQASEETWLAMRCLVGLAWTDISSGVDLSAKALLARALSFDPDGTSLYPPLSAVVAAVAELVVKSDAERGALIWAMAACLGNRARYYPMYAQDVARITEIVDRARETHGIPVPDVPADLTASDVIAECLEALAALDLAR